MNPRANSAALPIPACAALACVIWLGALERAAAAEPGANAVDERAALSSDPPLPDPPPPSDAPRSEPSEPSESSDSSELSESSESPEAGVPEAPEASTPSEESQTPQASSTVRWSHNLQLLAYATDFGAERDSVLNPGNRLVGFPERTANLEARLDLGVRNERCGANLRLRARYERYVEDEGATQPQRNREFFVNSGWAQCSIGDRFFAGAGREVRQWGSGFYASPSNPFFFDTGKTDPIREIYGKDFWEFGVYATPAITVSMMRNFRAGRLEPGAADYSPATALKIDWVGAEFSGGVIVSRRDDGPTRLGAYGTYIVSEATLLYADLAVGQGRRGRFAEPTADAIGWGFRRNPFDRDEFAYTALLGAAYTFESGWTGTADFLFGNEGYGRDERRRYDAAVDAAADRFVVPGPATSQAAGVLATAISPGLPYFSGNTLFLQIARNEWREKADVALRWVEYLAPGEGAAFSFSATYYLSSRLQAFAIGARNFGGPRSDAGPLLESSVLAGFRLFF